VAAGGPAGPATFQLTGVSFGLQLSAIRTAPVARLAHALITLFVVASVDTIADAPVATPTTAYELPHAPSCVTTGVTP
jgi:hypothetical protein